MNATTKTRRIRPADAAMLMRHALADAFPAHVITVAVAYPSNGLIVATVKWSDGPQAREVQEVADRFTGAVISAQGQIVPQLKPLHGHLVLFGLHVAYARRRVTAPTTTPQADAPSQAADLVAA